MINLKSLKVRISLIIIVVFSLLSTVIGLYAYNISVNIITNQINEKIQVINNGQVTALNKGIGDIRRNINRIQENSIISTYVGMITGINNRLSEAIANDLPEIEIEELRDQLSDSFLGGNLPFSVGANLDRELSRIEYAEYAYIVLNNGLVIGDSRINNIRHRQIINDYLGLNLAEEYYKDVSFGSFIENEGQSFLFLNHSIIDEEDNNEVLYYIVIAFSPEILGKNLSTSFGEMGNISLINGEGIILNDEKSDLVGNRINDQWFLEKLNNVTISGAETIGDYYKIISRIADENMFLAANIPTENLFGPAVNIRNNLFIFLLFGVLVAIGVIYFLVDRQLKPLIILKDSFAKLKEGQLKNSILLDESIEKKNDEFGDLAKNFNSMFLRLRKIIADIQNVSNTLTDSMANMSDTSSQVGSIAEQVGKSIEDIAAGAREQSDLISNTRKFVEDLNEEINEINSGSEKIIVKADIVSESIKNGNYSVKNSSQKVKNAKAESSLVANIILELGNTSKEIESIIELINSIAEQTNLLSLNAAIEAARAGEAGRGFSVVAEEIRDLAEESSDATYNISELIKKIQSGVNNAVKQMEQNELSVKESVKAIEDTGKTFTKIEEMSSDLRNLIFTISSNTENMAKNSRNLEEAMINVARVSQEFANHSEEIASSSEEQIASTEEIVSIVNTLDDLANKLNQMINSFEIDE